MPYRICKTFTVESGHVLSKHPGDCRFPHGHSRTIELVLTANTLDARDMVCDFKALKPAIAACARRYDHTLSLNTADPRFAELQTAYGDHITAFVDTDPTSEAMARDVYQTVAAVLADPPVATDFPIPPDVRLEKVRVTETASSWAEYWE
ncbi:MAG: 6-carboxytetrahydropterin synthase [Verrucomicrobiota bacterium]